MDKKKKLKTFTIHKPIWLQGVSYGRCIGIADHRLVDDLLVKIDYKTADGQRIYPDTYIIHPEQAVGKPTQQIKSHRLIIFQIDKLEIYRRGRNRKPKLKPEEATKTATVVQKSQITKPVQQKLF